MVWLFSQPQTGEVPELEMPKKAHKTREDSVLELSASVTKALIARHQLKEDEWCPLLLIPHEKKVFPSLCCLLRRLAFPLQVKSPLFLWVSPPKALMVKVPQNYTHPFPWGVQSLSNPPSPPLALLSDWEGDASRQATARSVDISPKREESNGKEMLILKKTASSHRHLCLFHALGIHLT